MENQRAATRRGDILASREIVTSRLQAFVRSTPAAYRLLMVFWGRLTPWLSRLLRTSAPRGVAATLVEAVDRSGGTTVAARAAEDLHWPSAVGLPKEHPAFVPVDHRLDDVVVGELPGGRVLGSHRAPLSGRGEYIHEIGQMFGVRPLGPYEHPVFGTLFPPPAEQLSGRIGVLASRGDSNFFHFSFDVLPRLAILELAGLRESVDRWYVPMRSQWQRDLLTAAGVDLADVVDSDQHPHIRAETLVLPGLATRYWPVCPPWVVQWLRRTMLPEVDSVPVGPPIFVTRNAPGVGRRNIVNEPEVIERLSARGFVVLDPSAVPFAEQIRAFAAAPMIVAAHGAALTNLAYAREGAGVIEIFPDRTLLPDCFRRLAYSVPGLRYRYLAGRELVSAAQFTDSLTDDIVVSLTDLEELLDDLSA